MPGQGVSDPLINSRYKLLIGNFNVGTMKERSFEIVEMLSRRRVDICCIKESRWPVGSARNNEGKDTAYKFSWKGDDTGFGVVDVLVASKWIDLIKSHLSLELTFVLCRYV